MLRTAARALRPGGLLLIVDHGSTAPWSWNTAPETRHSAPGEIATELDPDPEQLIVVRADTPRRRATGPAGQSATVTVTVTDNVLLIRRHDRDS